MIQLVDIVFQRGVGIMHQGIMQLTALGIEFDFFVHQGRGEMSGRLEPVQSLGDRDSS